MATDPAPANSAPAESVQATPSDGLDTSNETWDFEESDQDQPEPKPAETDSNSETDEVPKDQEAEEPAAEAPEETEQANEVELQAEKDGSVSITLPGGEKATLKELIAGNMRDRDYRHKTTELANKRRELEALSTRVTQSANAISEVLMKQVPPAPEPGLALSDFVRYMQEKAQHEGALEWVNSIVEKATSAKDVVNTLTGEQQKELISSEVAKLTEAFPDIERPEGKKKFFDGTMSAARELGISDQELGAVTDHRYFKVLHYAKLGLEAEAAKAKATQKVANVPPVATQKRPAGPNAAKARANQDSMKRLTSTGSIKDAMAVDFE